MQVKIFEAADMATGLRMIRQELGPDALILSTRTVKNGKFGLLGKNYLEITAAIDNSPSVRRDSAPQMAVDHGRKSTPQSVNTPYGHSVYKNSSAHREEELTAEDQPQRTQTGKSSPNEFDHDDTALKSHETNRQLRNEVDELKGLVKNLAGEISRMTVSASPSPARETAYAALEKRLFSTRANSTVEDLLLQHGINTETSRVMSGFAAEQLSAEDMGTPETLYAFLHSAIADLLPVNPPQFSPAEAEQRRIALIGPTGVGKTTTLAKIAARHLATASPSVALITIDTYRIAAVEQLKVYGEIMHLPVEVVLTPEQLAAALHKHSDKQLVLIDTAGRSHLDRFSIDELGTFLHPELAIESHLVLSAATRENELIQAISCFNDLNFHSTIYTKIDECSELGTILNTQIANRAPISYITNGQRVPEDILEINSQALAQLIVPHPNGTLHD